MLTLPAPLRAELGHAPRLVVAPVGIGFGQEALIRWARGEGRQVVREAGSLDEEPSLLLPSRRSQLARIPASTPLAHVLVIEESDALFRRNDWHRALGDLHPDFIESTFEDSEGLPLALDLCCRIGNSPTPLYRHPLAAVALERLLPQGALREAAKRVARTPLLVPELHEPLGLRAQEVAELLDTGYLWAKREGLLMPRLLRRFLDPQPEPATSLATAHLLADRGFLDEALLILSEAELWEPYLELLAAGFEPRPAKGEAQLRKALQRVPPGLHDRATYLYLVASLDRLRGELERAHENYKRARRKASAESGSDGSAEMVSRIDNARGISFALAGQLEEARRAFGSAVRRSGGGRLNGEARHNRAGVFIQQGRFADAEKDLRRAVAAFRQDGDYVREARSLQLLALSWHQRGLLHEAKRGYEDALELLTTLGQPTALLRANLAEVLLLSGEAAKAKEQLDEAAVEARADLRARGYVETNMALWLLSQGQVESAARRLELLLRQEGLEAHLRAEAELLLARALRLQGEGERALEHARRARALGVGAALEEALCEGGDLDGVIAQARREEARFETATALLNRGDPGDLEEALELIRTHGYRILLDSPLHAPALAALAQDDPAMLALFPMSVNTFGNLRIRFLGRELTLAHFPTRKSAALLLRLALSPRSLPREVLAEEFWSDAGNPVQSLQTGLYHLNRTLNAQVIGGRKGVVELVYPVQLDLDEFERRAAEALDHSWEQGPEAVRRAIAMAEGEPLADFPEWFEEVRRRTEGLKLQLWRRLADLEGERPRSAAEALESLLRLDPYDVESRRRLISIYSSAGEPERARQQEQRLQQLETELEPS